MASARLRLLPASHTTRLRLVLGPHAAQCPALQDLPSPGLLCVLQDTKERSAAGQHSATASRDGPYPDVSLGQVTAELGAVGPQQHRMHLMNQTHSSFSL